MSLLKAPLLPRARLAVICAAVRLEWSLFGSRVVLRLELRARPSEVPRSHESSLPRARLAAVSAAVRLEWSHIGSRMVLCIVFESVPLRVRHVAIALATLHLSS